MIPGYCGCGSGAKRLLRNADSPVGGLGCPRKVLLSAPIIVRNEEGTLPRCLDSIAGVVDEVVVADTGSTDGTKQVARQWGARVVDIPWRNDFSAARNEALSLATGEWILWIDADERLLPCDAGELRRLLEDPSNVACSVRVRMRPGVTPNRKFRLFRNSPEVRFAGIIHEDVFRGLEQLRQAMGGRYVDSDVVLEHDLTEVRGPQKHLRNLPILERAVGLNEKSLLALCHLADTYTALRKDRDAGHAWREAVARARHGDGLYRRHQCCAYLGLIEWEMDRGWDPSTLIEEAAARFPGNHQLPFIQGRLLMRQERYDEAIPKFESLVSMEPPRRYRQDDCYGYDERIFDSASHYCLGQCYAKLGNAVQSRRHLEWAGQDACTDMEKDDLAPRTVRGWPVSPWASD